MPTTGSLISSSPVQSLHRGTFLPHRKQQPCSREGRVAMASGTWHPARNGSRQGHSLQLRQGQVHRACVLRQLLSRGWHHRPMATGSQLPGIRTRASMPLPLDCPEWPACQPVPGSQDTARVFTAEPLNCAERIPPPAETAPERPDGVVPRAESQGECWIAGSQCPAPGRSSHFI